jgi:hypothetical protein
MLSLQLDCEPKAKIMMIIGTYTPSIYHILWHEWINAEFKIFKYVWNKTKLMNVLKNNWSHETLQCHQKQRKMGELVQINGE